MQPLWKGHSVLVAGTHCAGDLAERAAGKGASQGQMSGACRPWEMGKDLALEPAWAGGLGTWGCSDISHHHSGWATAIGAWGHSVLGPPSGRWSGPSAISPSSPCATRTCHHPHCRPHTGCPQGQSWPCGAGSPGPQLPWRTLLLVLPLPSPQPIWKDLYLPHKLYF